MTEDIRSCNFKIKHLFHVQCLLYVMVEIVQVDALDFAWSVFCEQVILKPWIWSHLTCQSLQTWWKSIFVNFPILSFQKTAIPATSEQQVCTMLL